MAELRSQTVTLLSGTGTVSPPTGTVTAMGFVHGPASLTSTAGQASGVLQLVSPTQTTSVSPGLWQELGHVSRLTIRFVPEPNALVPGLLAVLVLLRLRSRRAR